MADRTTISAGIAPNGGLQFSLARQLARSLRGQLPRAQVSLLDATRWKSRVHETEICIQYDTLFGARTLCKHLKELLAKEQRLLEEVQQVEEALFAPPEEIASLLTGLRDVGVLEEVVFYGYADFKYYAHSYNQTLYAPHTPQRVRHLCGWLESLIRYTYCNVSPANLPPCSPELREQLMTRLSDLYRAAGGHYI